MAIPLTSSKGTSYGITGQPVDFNKNSVIPPVASSTTPTLASTNVASNIGEQPLPANTIIPGIDTTDIKVNPSIETDTTAIAEGKNKYDIQSLLAENAKIREQYLQSLQPTEQELGLEQQIAQIKESAGLGIQNIKEQTIPMGAIVGQAKNVEERANLQLSTLADQLGIAQKGRLANQESLKAIGGFVGEDINLMTQIQDRIDKQNQQIIDNATKLGTDARDSLAMILDNFKGVDPNELDATSQAQISQIAANAGLTPSLVFAGMKAVKDQQDFENYQKLKGTEKETSEIASPVQLAQVKGNIDLISGLTEDKYLSSAVGPNTLSRLSISNWATGGKSNFVAGIRQLQSELSLESLIRAKERGATFGALSEGELGILSASASKLGTWEQKDDKGNVVGYKANEKDFRKELDKINNFAKLDFIYRGGNPEEIGAVTMPDGTIWTKNSDGTLTQIL